MKTKITCYQLNINSFTCLSFIWIYGLCSILSTNIGVVQNKSTVDTLKSLSSMENNTQKEKKIQNDQTHFWR